MCTIHKINTEFNFLQNIYQDIAFKVKVHDKMRKKYTMSSSIERH